MSVIVNASTSTGLGITSDNSGTVEIQSNGSTKLTVSSSGVSVGTLSTTAINATTVTGAITLDTAKSATGSTVDFTGIPSWAKKITIIVNGVSTNNGGTCLIYLGTSSGIDSSGYAGSAVIVAKAIATNGDSITNAFYLMVSGSFSYTSLVSGHLTLTNISTNTWVLSGVVGSSTAVQISSFSTGTKTLSGVLDRIRFTSDSSFDAGSFNLMYEG